MLNSERFNEILTIFKKDFSGEHWKDEKFKWEAVKRFQTVWDIDEPNFADMFMQATDQTYGLLTNSMNFPRGMIKDLATADPEFVRGMFVRLFDESVDLKSRFEQFVTDAEKVRSKYDTGSWKNHYQTANAVTTYLWLRYPDKYYIYKYSECIAAANEIGGEDYQIKGNTANKILTAKRLYDDISERLRQDKEMQDIVNGCLTDDCYPDPQMHTLAIDFCFYINRYMEKWWPSVDEYNPKITKNEWKEYIVEIELPHHPRPMQMLKSMVDSGGEVSCKKLAELYGGTASGYIGCAVALGKRAKSYFELPACIDGDQERFFPVAFLGKKGDGEYLYKIRPELYDALKEIDLSSVSLYYEEKRSDMNNTDIAKNTILFGPPGTGKTYNSAIYAVSIIEKKPLEEVAEEAKADYYQVMKRYNKYKDQGIIEFTTFHQSFGYEEFIEGIKPVVEDDSDIGYAVVPGVFKAFCDRITVPEIKMADNAMLNEAPTVWKVSLEGTGDNPTRKECLANGHIRVGFDSYGKNIDKAIDNQEFGYSVLNRLVNEMAVGDIVVSCYTASTVDAVGVVTGEYEWHPEYEEYKRLRKVKWLVKNIEENIVKINNGKKLANPTVHRVNISVNDAMDIVKKYSPDVLETENKGNYVFIIDEINRGNISKIFGELITLIEPTKRIGQPEEMKAKLPYSQKYFGIPDNVYIIGTMNTADRSIATIDTALRRRFDFKEMLPQTDVLKGIEVDGVDIAKMLDMINRRIEALYDREHMIGHAYFLPLKEDCSVENLAGIFKNKIIPLLQEYFYENYERIRLVLGDNQKEKEAQFILKEDVKEIDLFGENTDEIEDVYSFSVNEAAFTNIEAYKKMI